MVQRAALRMWFLALGGIPLLVVAVDVLTNRRITNWLRELIFNPNDTQIYEPRDVIWAWALLLFSGALVLWGLKELFVPTKVLECRDEGLALKLRGPLRPADLVPWANMVDVDGSEIEDEGDLLPLLRVKLHSREGLPDHPWGARWIEPRVLGVLAQDWSVDPGTVAAKIGDYAIEAAREAARSRTARLWGPS